MRILFLIPMFALVSCYTQKSVKSFARHNGLSVREVGSINLLGGVAEIKEKRDAGVKPVFLFYNGDNLEYLSTDNSITKSSTGELIYKVQKSGDTAYMLTRSGQLRYFVEDTFFFMRNYVIHSQCLYDGNVAKKGKVVQAFFNAYHFSTDSLLHFSAQTSQTLLSVFNYMVDSAKTREFFEKESTLRKTAAISKADFISTIMR